MILYLLLIIAAVACAGNFAVTKVYQKNMGNGIREGVIFNIITGLFGSVVFFVIFGCRLEYTTYSMIMAVIFSLLVGTYTIIGFYIMSIGSMTVYTMFLMLGGAVVPYIYGILFLGETVNIWKILALLLVVLAVILNAYDGNKKKQSAVFILLCILVFFINGFVSVTAKMHQIETRYTAVDSQSFLILKNIVRCLIFLAALPFCKNKEHNKIKLGVKMYLVILASTLFSGASFILQLICAKRMPATVIYPMVTGGTILSASVFDRVFFKQRLSIAAKISIAVCVVALVLFVV